MQLLRLFLVFSICAWYTTAFGQEAAPAAQEASADDDSYFALRRSKDRARKLTADRYLNLVKPQEWTDLTGKFRTVAKYVDHDPDLKWVKLEAARGRGADRIVKQIQVPVDKLSKQCQSRVRQIARLKPKMDELVVAEAEAQKEDVDGEGATRGEASEERLAEVNSERMADFGEGSEAGSESGVEGAVDRNIVGREALVYGAPPGGPAVDPGQWRTSLVAFQQNISITPGPGGALELVWGELHELRALSEALASLSSKSSNERDRGGGAQRVADAAATVGDVTWKAPFMGLTSGLLGSKPIFGMPPIAAPVTIQFVLADAEHMQHWAKLRPGQMVRFHGQLKMTGPNSIVVWVRMSDETAAEVDAQAPAEPPSADAPTARPAAVFVPTSENPR